MNQRFVSTIARALSVAGFGVILAACSAQVGTGTGTENEQEGTTSQALPQGCANDNAYVICPSQGVLGGTDFENGLVAVGCVDKMLYEGEGPLARSFFEAKCSKGKRGTFLCGQTNTYVTGDVYTLVSCWGGVAPIYFSLSETSSCGCQTEAPSGKIYVHWDPTCTGSRCIVTIRDF